MDPLLPVVIVAVCLVVYLVRCRRPPTDGSAPTFPPPNVRGHRPRTRRCFWGSVTSRSRDAR